MLNKNIILSGFMGSGKSVIAKLLSIKLKINFIDLDNYIVQESGLTIPEIFNKSGESFFRALEHKYLKSLSKNQPLIISTGGGAMTFKRNFDIVKNNSIVFFIDRNFDNIFEAIKNDTNRPLANKNSKENLHNLFNLRFDKYLKYSHFHVDNNKDIDTCINKIITLIQE